MFIILYSYCNVFAMTLDEYFQHMLQRSFVTFIYCNLVSHASYLTQFIFVMYLLYIVYYISPFYACFIPLHPCFHYMLFLLCFNII